MKRILFFLTLFAALAGNLNAQAEFTGNGDGVSWDDPFNWESGEVPQFGDDILINGFFVYYFGDGGEVYGNIELAGSSDLFIAGDLYLYGNFTVGEFSSLTMDVGSDGRFNRVVFDNEFLDEENPPQFIFDGLINVDFTGYVPRIDDEFEFFEGTQGLCDTPVTILTSDSLSKGFEVTLGSQCVEGETDSVIYKVTDITYTTAIQWDGEAGDGLWNSPTNWKPDGVPPPNSLLIFNLPGAGGYAKTNGAVTTTAYNIKIGKNNTLEINGDLSMTSTIYNNPEGTLIWNTGELSKVSSTQSLLINYGTINLNTSGVKKIDDDFEVWSFRGFVNHNEGNLEINNGKIRLFNDTEYNVGNNVSIGYGSGVLHDFEIGVRAMLKKDNSTGTSTIDLTNFENNGEVICETGTLNISGSLTSGVNVFGFYNASYNGSAAIGFPTGHVLQGDIYPGSSSGVLTIVDDLTTGTDADFIIEINGPNAGTDYDQIIVTNEAILDGNIDIQLGYLPDNDASFEILSAGALTSCNFPATITRSFGGISYTFNVICANNTLYLNGPGVVLSNENKEIQDVSIYPNPVKDVLNVKSSTISVGHWKLINQMGQVIKQADFNSNTLKISLSNIPTGFYFFKLEDSNLKASITRKVMISN